MAGNASPPNRSAKIDFFSASFNGNAVLEILLARCRFVLALGRQISGLRLDLDPVVFQHKHRGTPPNVTLPIPPRPHGVPLVIADLANNERPLPEHCSTISLSTCSSLASTAASITCGRSIEAGQLDLPAGERHRFHRDRIGRFLIIANEQEWCRRDTNTSQKFGGSFHRDWLGNMNHKPRIFACDKRFGARRGNGRR